MLVKLFQLLSLVVAVFLLAGCRADLVEVSSTTLPVWETPPVVDTSIHSVPLSDIHFDTFQPRNRAVALDRADAELIESLVDAIPPIYDPVFEPATAGDDWLAADDLVLGYANESAAFAYPVRILNFHEIVLHEVDGVPLMATYCPLCRSGVMYDRRVAGETLWFGNTSALYQSDMVMFDHESGSYWVQVSGEAIVGARTGQRLTPLPSQTTTWAAWRALHPETQVLSRETGHSRNYARDPFAGYVTRLNNTGRFAFPVTDAADDPRLLPGTIVLGVQLDETVAVYDLDALGDGMVNDVVGNRPVVVFGTAAGPAGAAFDPRVDDRPLTFEWRDGQIYDLQTGSQWDTAGRAVAGELVGTALTPLPVRTTLWFSLIATFPDLELRQTP